MSNLEIQSVYPLEQSCFREIPTEIVTTHFFDPLAYAEANGFIRSCTAIYSLYIRHSTQNLGSLENYLIRFINNRSSEDLGHAIRYCSKQECPLTIDLQLSRAKNLDEHFQKLLTKFSISCIRILVEPYHGSDSPRQPSVLSRLASMLFSCFSNGKLQKTSEETLAIQKAQQLSRGLPFLSPTLQCMHIAFTGNACFNKKVFEKITLPSTLKQLVFYAYEVDKVMATAWSSLPNLEKLDIIQPNFHEGRVQIPLPAFVTSLIFPNSLRSFSLTGQGISNMTPVILAHLAEQCPNLEELDLSSKAVIPEGVLLPKNLKTVRVSGEKLSIFLETLFVSSPGIESLTIILDHGLQKQEVWKQLLLFKNLKSIYFAASPFWLYTHAVQLLRQENIDILVEMGITFLTFETTGGVSCFLMNHWKPLLNQLKTLTINYYGRSEKKEDPLGQLREKYPSLSIMVDGQVCL